MYIGAIVGEHADVATLVALLDTRPRPHGVLRVRRLRGALGRPAELPQYAPDGLEK